ncbi:Peptidase S24/S26A/S26B/S26C [Gracilaria domingensis]|nr:Peptidase S24/S26A/S26B/S26C [Gracilaria domingensis]
MITRILSFLSYVPLAIVFHDNVATMHIETTDDMEPTIPSNTPCIITRNAKPSNYRRGEILAIMAPDGRLTLRRVVALPGDYVREARATTIVPHGYIWVERDRDQTNCALPRGKTPIALVTGRLTASFGGNAAVIPSKKVVSPHMPYN